MLVIVIREALATEAKLLSALALRSKAHWDYSQDFIEACKAELTYSPEQIGDIDFDFIIAEKESAIAGFYALKRNSHTVFELEALFVEPERIGTGVGRRLIEHAVASVAAKGGEALTIQGDPNAERFYLAAGGTKIGSLESGSIPGRLLPLFEIRIAG